MTADQALASTSRERLLDVAYELFSQRGIRDVGVDELVKKSGVAKATLYKYFGSKDGLAHAFLRHREQEWTFGMIETEALARGTTPREHLLAIFDVLDEWFHSTGFEGCSFINVLLEMGPHHRLGQASIAHLENIRTIVTRLAVEAQLDEPREFARCWHILMKGSIIAAAEGDRQAAIRAGTMARRLIEEHTPDEATTSAQSVTV